jgi:hypothetical protein
MFLPTTLPIRLRTLQNDEEEEVVMIMVEKETFAVNVP